MLGNWQIIEKLQQEAQSHLTKNQEYFPEEVIYSPKFLSTYLPLTFSKRELTQKEITDFLNIIVKISKKCPNNFDKYSLNILFFTLEKNEFTILRNIHLLETYLRAIYELKEFLAFAHEEIIEHLISVVKNAQPYGGRLEKDLIVKISALILGLGRRFEELSSATSFPLKFLMRHLKNVVANLRSGGVNLMMGDPGLGLDESIEFWVHKLIEQKDSRDVLIEMLVSNPQFLVCFDLKNEKMLDTIIDQLCEKRWYLDSLNFDSLMDIFKKHRAQFLKSEKRVKILDEKFRKHIDKGYLSKNSIDDYNQYFSNYISEQPFITDSSPQAGFTNCNYLNNTPSKNNNSEFNLTHSTPNKLPKTLATAKLVKSKPHLGTNNRNSKHHLMAHQPRPQGPSKENLNLQNNIVYFKEGELAGIENINTTNNQRQVVHQGDSSCKKGVDRSAGIGENFTISNNTISFKKLTNQTTTNQQEISSSMIVPAARRPGGGELSSSNIVQGNVYYEKTGCIDENTNVFNQKHNYSILESCETLIGTHEHPNLGSEQIVGNQILRTPKAGQTPLMEIQVNKVVIRDMRSSVKKPLHPKQEMKTIQEAYTREIDSKYKLSVAGVDYKNSGLHNNTRLNNSAFLNGSRCEESVVIHKTIDDSFNHGKPENLNLMEIKSIKSAQKPKKRQVKQHQYESNQAKINSSNFDTFSFPQQKKAIMKTPQTKRSGYGQDTSREVELTPRNSTTENLSGRRFNEAGGITSRSKCTVGSANRANPPGSAIKAKVMKMLGSSAIKKTEKISPKKIVISPNGVTRERLSVSPSLNNKNQTVTKTYSKYSSQISSAQKYPITESRDVLSSVLGTVTKNEAVGFQSNSGSVTSKKNFASNYYYSSQNNYFKNSCYSNSENCNMMLNDSTAKKGPENPSSDLKRLNRGSFGGENINLNESWTNPDLKLDMLALTINEEKYHQELGGSDYKLRIDQDVIAEENSNNGFDQKDGDEIGLTIQPLKAESQSFNLVGSSLRSSCQWESLAEFNQSQFQKSYGPGNGIGNSGSLLQGSSTTAGGNNNMSQGLNKYEIPHDVFQMNKGSFYKKDGMLMPRQSGSVQDNSSTVDMRLQHCHLITSNKSSTSELFMPQSSAHELSGKKTQIRLPHTQRTGIVTHSKPPLASKSSMKKMAGAHKSGIERAFGAPVKQIKRAYSMKKCDVIQNGVSSTSTLKPAQQSREVVEVSPPTQQTVENLRSNSYFRVSFFSFIKEMIKCTTNHTKEIFEKLVKNYSEREEYKKNIMGILEHAGQTNSSLFKRKKRLYRNFSEEEKFYEENRSVFGAEFMGKFEASGYPTTPIRRDKSKSRNQFIWMTRRDRTRTSCENTFRLINLRSKKSILSISGLPFNAKDIKGVFLRNEDVRTRLLRNEEPGHCRPCLFFLNGQAKHLHYFDLIRRIHGNVYSPQIGPQESILKFEIFEKFCCIVPNPRKLSVVQITDFTVYDVVEFDMDIIGVFEVDTGLVLIVTKNSKFVYFYSMRKKKKYCVWFDRREPAGEWSSCLRVYPENRLFLVDENITVAEVNLRLEMLNLL